MHNDDEIKRQRSTIVQLYIVLVFALIAGFIPNGYVQGLGLVLLVVLMVAVPLYGVSAPQGSILKSHMRYLNNTIWAGSTLLFIGAALGIYWVYQSGDHGAITSLQEQVNSGSMISEFSIYAAMDAYMATNMSLILKASLICLGPPMLYIVVRIFHALGRVTQGDHA